MYVVYMRLDSKRVNKFVINIIRRSDIAESQSDFTYMYITF